MAARLQNRIAESRYTLPVLLLATVGVWWQAGFVEGQWWGALACFVATVAMLIQLNKSCALIRVYSPVISCSFLVLSMTACPLFADFHAAFVQMCMVGYILLLFHTYGDTTAAGPVYYAYLCIAVASLFFVQILCLLPFLWLMQDAMIRSLSGRTWMAALFGVLTPYWCWAGVLVLQQDFTPFVAHFMPLTEWSMPLDITVWNIGQMGVMALLLLTSIIGTVYYLRQGRLDSTRVRFLYGFFIGMVWLTVVALLLQPTLYTWLVPLILVFVSPLIAHFTALTDTRLTNITVLVCLLLALLLTIYSLWPSFFIR